MNRRQFAVGASAALVAAALGADRIFGDSSSHSLRVRVERETSAMPLDFCGFSYESAQLADPTYFSGANRALVRQFRKLSNRGVLRLGGNLSDVTLWDGGKDSQADSGLSPEAAKGITTRFEWKLVGRRAGEKRPATITPESIRALSSFLQATEWKLLYGLNLGSGTPERAAEEAACVAEHAGNSLLAFQVGNEADFFGRSFRRHGWDFNRYWEDFGAM